MLYSFKSVQPHTILSLIYRSIYKLLWPLVISVAVALLFPASNLVKDQWHLYSFLVAEVVNMIVILTTDSFNEIEINTAKKSIAFSYYNIYQGTVQEKYLLSEVKVKTQNAYKKGVDQISFFIKKQGVFFLKKDKDNFSLLEIESLSELLNKITSPEKK